MPHGEAAFGPLLERVLARDAEVGRELENVLYWMHYSVSYDFDPKGFDSAREALERYIARETAAFRLPARVALVRLTATLDQDPLAVEAAVKDYRVLLEEDIPVELRTMLQGELFVLTNLRVGLEAPDLVWQGRGRRAPRALRLPWQGHGAGILGLLVRPLSR